mgnify:CR=1 FL=1
MKIADALITIIVFLLALAASFIIGKISEAFIGEDGIYLGIIIFLFCLRQILIWHKVKKGLVLPDMALAILFSWLVYTHLSPFAGTVWGIFAGVIVFLTGLAMIAHMQAWEIP